MTPGPGFEPGTQQWEVSALTPAPSLRLPASSLFYCSNNIVFLKVSNLLLSFKMIFTEDSSNNGKNYVTNKKTLIASIKHAATRKSIRAV